METVAMILIAIAAASQTAFVLRFGTRRWWETFLGRAVFTKSVALWALLVAEVVTWFLPVPMWVAVAIIAGITVGIVWQTVALFDAGKNQTEPTENQR